VDHITHATCWKCGETFHLAIQKDNVTDSGTRVVCRLPCPFCGASCMLEMPIEDLARVSLLRTPGQQPTPPTWQEIEAGSLAKRVFLTRAPTDEEAT